MSDEMKARCYTGVAGGLTASMLWGTTGLTFVFGWSLWAVGVGVLLVAVRGR